MAIGTYTFVLLAGVSLVSLPLLVAASEPSGNAEARLAKIEATLEKVLEKNEQLERRVAVLEEENGALKEMVLGMVREKPAEQDTGTKQQEQPGQDSRVAEIVQARHVPLHYKRQFVADTVAFTAVVVPGTIDVGPGQTIIYDHAITNVGGAYDTSTGIFTAPVSGVYTFNFAEMVEPNQNEYLELVKEGQHIMWNFGHASGAPHYTSSSRTTTLAVNRGERVWVRTQQSSTHGSGHIHGNTFTTFSGWIVAYSE